MQTFPVKLTPNLQISFAVALLRNCIHTSIHLTTLTTLLKQRIVKVDRIQPYLRQRNITLPLVKMLLFDGRRLWTFCKQVIFFTILLIKNLKLFSQPLLLCFCAHQVILRCSPLRRKFRSPSQSDEKSVEFFLNQTKMVILTS